MPIGRNRRVLRLPLSTLAAISKTGVVVKISRSEPLPLKKCWDSPEKKFGENYFKGSGAFRLYRLEDCPDDH